MRLAPVAIAGLFVLAVAPVVYLAITLGRALDGQLTIQAALHLVMTLASLVGLVVFVVLISRDRRLDGHPPTLDSGAALVARSGGGRVLDQVSHQG